MENTVKVKVITGCEETYSLCFFIKNAEKNAKPVNSSMNKNIHTISTKPENADKYSYMHNYIQLFSHKSKKCHTLHKKSFGFRKI